VTSRRVADSQRLVEGWGGTPASHNDRSRVSAVPTGARRVRISQRSVEGRRGADGPVRFRHRNEESDRSGRGRSDPARLVEGRVGACAGVPRRAERSSRRRDLSIRLATHRAFGAEDCAASGNPPRGITDPVPSEPHEPTRGPQRGLVGRGGGRGFFAEGQIPGGVWRAHPRLRGVFHRGEGG
jgi:hypothetical protein